MATIKQHENNLEKLRKEYLRLKAQINVQEAAVKQAREKRIARTLPKLGTEVYIPKTPDNFSPLEEGDMLVCQGGLGKIVHTAPTEYHNVSVSLRGNVSGKEFQKRYTWKNLFEQQDELKRKYRNKQALMNEDSYYLAEIGDLVD